jgi:hypothetical protein
MKSKRIRALERLARKWPKDDSEKCCEAFWAFNPEDVAMLVIDLAMLTGHSELMAARHAAGVELTLEPFDGDEPTSVRLR